MLCTAVICSTLTEEIYLLMTSMHCILSTFSVFLPRECKLCDLFIPHGPRYFVNHFSLQPKKLSLCYKLWFFNLFLNCNPKKSRRSHSIKSVFANFTTFNKVQAYFIFQFNFSNALSWILRGMQGSNCKHISCRVSL